jgi:hypothetical protein
MEPLKVLASARKRFGSHTPTVKEIQAFLDPGTGLALAALLLALWQYFFPDGEPRRKKPRCEHVYSNGKKCGAEFIHATKRGKTITLTCQRGHATKILTK